MTKTRSYLTVAASVVVIAASAFIGRELGSDAPDEDSGDHVDGLPMSSMLVEQPASFEQLVAESPAIVLVTAMERIEDYWPPTDPQLTVLAQFRLRVDRVLKGSIVEGEHIVVRLPGGTSAMWGDPNPGGSFKPVPGEETQEIEYADFPFFRKGTQELIFLSSLDEGATAYGATAFGRYRLVKGRLAPVVDEVHHDAGAPASGGPLAPVLGATIDTVAERVALALMQANP